MEKQRLGKHGLDIDAGGPQGPQFTPARIAVIYAVAGALWILFSDQLLEVLVPSGPLNAAIQTAKGWVFVAVSTALLLVLMRRQARQREAVAGQVRAVLDSIGDAVLVVDPDLRVVDGNRAALRLFGVSSKAELLGPLVDLAAASRMRLPDGSPILPKDFASVRALRGETVRRMPVVFRPGTDVEVAAEVTAAPVEDRTEGPVRFAVAVFRDVSEVRRLDDMRDEFLATAAHEFKTPLAVIKAYVQLLQRRSAPDAPALDVVNRQVDRLSRLVQQLLEVARFRVGGPDLRLAEYDLSKQVEEVLDRMRRAAGGHRLHLATAPSAAVRADRGRIEQVLVSLLDNALKFSPRGGDVTVAVLRGSGEAVVSVRDAGMGIPPERQERLFSRYYRAHEDDPDDRGGFGLGLDLAREIVSRHGGRVWFESEAGTGSTFFFSLPLAAEAPRASA
ncbi:MAG TPA: PAS domain-containing sensor histidine kinase [Anaeromyxobacteraceae bacterium]|nr:PAS domain-containing sensor histidine kinase [Anaeromyxobacteraceae bacterium]